MKEHIESDEMDGQYKMELSKRYTTKNIVIKTEAMILLWNKVGKRVDIILISNMQVRT